MHHLVVPRFHFAHGHVPARRRRGLEHRAGRRADAAHRSEEMARAARTVGVLVAEALLVAGRLHDPHPLPVGFEFIGHDHRHAGADALPHLGPVNDDGDRAVLTDRDERQGVVDPPVRHAVCAVLGLVLGAQGRREPDGEDEPAERGHSDEKTPPAHVRELGRVVGRRVTGGGAHRIAWRLHFVAPF